MVASRILTLEKLRGSKLGWKGKTKGLTLKLHLHYKSTVLLRL